MPDDLNAELAKVIGTAIASVSKGSVRYGMQVEMHHVIASQRAAARFGEMIAHQVIKALTRDAER